MNDISQLLSLNLANVISFKDQTFWVIFYAILSLTYAWILILLISAFRVPLCGWLKSKIEVIKLISIPIMPNYMFLPITVVLLCVLSCDKAIGADLHESYLNYDCNQFCWTDSHLSKVIPASFLIMTYIPLAILYRTLWQEGNSQVNIRTNSLYLVLKNIAYVALVVLGKTLKNDYSLAHAFVYGGIILAIFVVLNVKTPYNYDRATLWSKVLVVCVSWNCLICIFSISLESDSLVWLLMQILGWIGILVVGVILQSKLPPSLIVTEKGRNIYNLFRFAFGYEDYKPSQYIELDIEQDEDNS